MCSFLNALAQMSLLPKFITVRISLSVHQALDGSTKRKSIGVSGIPIIALVNKLYDICSNEKLINSTCLEKF